MDTVQRIYWKDAFGALQGMLIDYICAHGRFLMSPSGMAVSNTRYLSSSGTRVNAGIRGWNCTYLKQLHAKHLLVVSVSQISE